MNSKEDLKRRLMSQGFTESESDMMLSEYGKWDWRTIALVIVCSLLLAGIAYMILGRA